MSVKQTSIYVVRMRFVTITWDHTTAAAVLGTLEMDKPVLVIVKFLLIGCYYIFFFVVMSIIVLRFFLHKGVKKKTKEIVFQRFGNVKTPLSRNGFKYCIHSFKFRVL